MATKTVKAIYRKGLIKPLEEIEIREGEEITITILEKPLEENGFEKAFGSWKDLVDESFEKEIYEQRKVFTRPGVKL